VPDYFFIVTDLLLPMLVLAKLMISTVLMIHLLCSQYFNGILVGFGPHIGCVFALLIALLLFEFHCWSNIFFA